MSRAWWLSILVACHPGQPRDPEGPPPPGCKTVGHHMLDMMMPKDPVPPQTVKVILDLIVERCDQDKWSADAQNCLMGMKSLDDQTRCEEMLTMDQREALAKGIDEKFPKDPKPAPGP